MGEPVTAYVRSVNVGAAQDLPGAKGIPSGIAKVPAESIDVRDPGAKRDGLGSGVVGDFIGDRRHHGGDAQAVYAVAREELDHWAAELGRPLPDGMFGENLTTEAIDVDAALIGEEWVVGRAVLRVTGPRAPCSTFTAHMGVKGWGKRFVARGRTGAYLAVVEPGTIRRGDRVVVRSRPDHDVTVPVSLRAWYGDEDARDRMRALGLGWT